MLQGKVPYPILILLSLIQSDPTTPTNHLGLDIKSLIILILIPGLQSVNQYGVPKHAKRRSDNVDGMPMFCSLQEVLIRPGVYAYG